MGHLFLLFHIHNDEKIELKLDDVILVIIMKHKLPLPP